MTPLRQCGRALLVFLLAAVPFHFVAVRSYVAAALAVSGFIVKATGPAEDVIRAPSGVRVVDRRGALDEFFSDPDQRPPDYGILAVWSWIAAAPALTLLRRLKLAACALVVIGAADVLALGLLALAWYYRALADQVVDLPPAWAHWEVVLETCGTVLGVTALLVAPVVIAVHAYPGLTRSG